MGLVMSALGSDRRGQAVAFIVGPAASLRSPVFATMPPGFVADAGFTTLEPRPCGFHRGKAVKSWNEKEFGKDEPQ